MKKLLKNCKVVDVIGEKIIDADVLLDGKTIVEVGAISDGAIGEVEVIDLKGKYLCPAFSDGHIHIESSMLMPQELAKVCLVHGTTSFFADPHEIANVCGKDGIRFMIEESENIPFDAFFTLPSCVPATPFDESFSPLLAEDLEEFYKYPRVAGLAEMMNFVGVLNDDPDIIKKIEGAKRHGKIVNGHAPLLTGAQLDKYVSMGIVDDHECTNFEEAKEKYEKGMSIMIRQGTSAQNLVALMPLFKKPYTDRCMLVCDDKHPADLLENGHIDSIIRSSVALGADPVLAIKMATINPAVHFKREKVGAIEKGYLADLVVLQDLEAINVEKVFKNGQLVVDGGKLINFGENYPHSPLLEKVRSSFKIKGVSKEDFMVQPKSNKARVIKIVKGEVLTEEVIAELDFSKGNGIDLTRDILKIAVFERHNGTGNRTVGFITGLQFKTGALATSISHDSHNLIVVGTNEEDMALAANKVIEMGGGSAVIKDGQVVGSMPLPIAGLMSELSAEQTAKQNASLRKSVYTLGCPEDFEPLMTTAFISLSVIPHIKITTQGLIDVNNQKKLDLFC